MNYRHGGLNCIAGSLDIPNLLYTGYTWTNWLPEMTATTTLVTIKETIL